MVVYFSGTGNSRYCAEYLAERLQDELLDSRHYIRHQIAADLIGGKPWVFVAPTYAWRMPQAFFDFIRTGDFKGDDRAWFVLTCGGEIGAAGKSLEALCAQVGLRYMGVVPVEMPNNYLFGRVPDQTEAKEIIRAAQPVLARAAEWIEAGKAFPQANLSILDRLKSKIIAPSFAKYAAKPKSFRVSDACISCGACEESCPLGNIRLENGRPVWGERCALCLACIGVCRRQAINYGKATVGKRRYFCTAHPQETEE